MKVTFETNEEEAKYILKAQDYFSALMEIRNELRNNYKNDNYPLVEQIQEILAPFDYD